MRKFAIVPAIFAGILFLYANGASAGGTSRTSYGTTFYSLGGVTGTSRTSYGTTFYNFGGVTGTSRTSYGTTFYSGALFGD